MTTWRWIAAILALTQLAAPFVTQAVAGDFLESGATNAALITPAGYAFSLWGLITVLSAATMLAVLRFGLGAWWETRVLVDASVVFAGFSVWLLVAAQGWLWVSVAVFALMVSALSHIMRLLVRRSHDLTCARWLAVLATATFGLYLGWSSIAVFANVAAALIDSGVPATAVWWQLAVLVAAAAFAVGLARMLRGTPAYVAGVLWALVAIAIGAAQRGSAVLATTAMLAAALVLVAAVTAMHRRRV
ncbi:hypothetical protein H7I53_00345 [Mycolicibacterium pulveris]|uniref:Uncharacterized protein n=1 Tax=Mycolicibacterium pulveris TaxID=36813 RepID=A0A7I7UFU4_MYCPV|nr:hypothetical protein [Mycolicibacterium pulveris]MCV6978680.1 hypothetical protein [Mycolicibacterium pulveris]BBY80125.1 hypothetical protein MPUL_12830 [Mycolicibacterium pulveris]